MMGYYDVAWGWGQWLAVCAMMLVFWGSVGVASSSGG